MFLKFGKYEIPSAFSHIHIPEHRLIWNQLFDFSKRKKISFFFFCVAEKKNPGSMSNVEVICFKAINTHLPRSDMNPPLRVLLKHEI